MESYKEFQKIPHHSPHLHTVLNIIIREKLLYPSRSDPLCCDACRNSRWSFKSAVSVVPNRDSMTLLMLLKNICASLGLWGRSHTDKKIIYFQSPQASGPNPLLNQPNLPFGFVICVTNTFMDFIFTQKSLIKLDILQY